MSGGFSQEPMLDMYIFETTQLIEQLENLILNNEKSGCLSEDNINEIFRIMHTIKGSSSMMMFDSVTIVSHSMEDLFYFIRKNGTQNIDYSKLFDIVLTGIDFVKAEVSKIIEKSEPDGDASALISNINSFLFDLRQDNQTASNRTSIEKSHQIEDEQKYYINSVALDISKHNSFKAVICFEDDCGMEDVRAFSIVHNIKEFSEEIYHIPEKISENEKCVDIIREKGFKIFFRINKDYEEVYKLLMQTGMIKTLELTELENNKELKWYLEDNKQYKEHTSSEKDMQSNAIEDDKKNIQSTAIHQSMISVNVNKLDKLMDMVGELVISQAMVIQNPDLNGLQLDNFQKAARQLQKITSELQDIVMSIRMVPLAATFQKMNRLVRDMSKKLSKEITLEIIGEDTEVDKNIIEHISDPLMHLIRNAIDHGIEPPEERIAKGKPAAGKITLEAKNEGGDVVITIKDNGKGLNREKILERAMENGLINRANNEISDKEVFSYIFLPGFSTRDEITEFSGRGVGMDVVAKNIATVGGNVSVDSIPGECTTVTFKIPLTLVIMDGMTISVGKSAYTLPTISIKESFRAKDDEIINDIDGNEMIMIRGECYPILRLHQLYKVKTEITSISDGILIMVSNEGKSLCIFADKLLGEQQVVVKALPDYIKKFKKIRGLAGCTLLGDGSISLILDIAGLINYKRENGNVR